MVYGETVQNTRQLFFISWQKHRNNQPLSPLEKQIVDVIIDHPEYHDLLQTVVKTQTQSYFPELGQTNPFLHMGLHLAIRDQIATDRPAGITTIFSQLLHQYKDRLIVEHVLMEPLAECLWQAQRTGNLPDEVSYIKACTLLSSVHKFK
jgi:hypothetical protein